MNFIAACAHLARISACFIIFFAQGTSAQEIQASWGPAAPSAPAPWRVVGLPSGKTPLTRFDVVALEGRSVLRVQADGSYANLVQYLPAGNAAGWLRWKWRVDQSLPQANLRTKAGDDVALKVCALFDMPLQDIPLVDRALLGLARAVSSEHLPGATLCYVWDNHLAPGTELVNAYSSRVRFRVLNTSADSLGHWESQARDLRGDFLRSFGHETRTVPPLLAVAVGADADNTHGRSLAYVSDLQHTYKEVHDSH